MDAIIRRRLLMLGPLGIAAAGSGVFWALMLRMQQGKYDPHALQSMLVGKPLPDFTLPGQTPSAGFSNTDVNRGKLPALVNFFASWCIPCVEESSALDELARQGVTIWGIAYKDKVAATAGFLTRYGDPYHQVARDADGRTAINFGLYGVPETYVVDRTGIVRLRYAGGLSSDSVRDTILPLLRKLG
ncbi:MAG: DsbE family thiol:disulfide interchange protein [Proteobacteria bacterium]|nr:DsbE family thiol:disulfide interchange protein [Pseudomonadota bacterium]